MEGYIQVQHKDHNQQYEREAIPLANKKVSLTLPMYVILVNICEVVVLVDPMT